MVQVDEEGYRPDESLDEVDGDVDDDSDGEAGTDCEGCLSIVACGEDVGVLERPVGANEGELRAAEDGVGVKVGHVGRRVSGYRPCVS